jgi:hypothetical protein
MRALVRLLDAYLCRRYGVFGFSDDPECILRLQVSQAPRRISLLGFELQPGQPVLMIHLWNEKLPLIPAEGANLAWGKSAQRKLLHSLNLAAHYLEQTPQLEPIRAVGGVTALFPPDERSGGNKLFQRLGFTVMPYHSSLGRFGEFWENFYSWMLVWTYNPASLRDGGGLTLFATHRSEIWISRECLLSRYA